MYKLAVIIGRFQPFHNGHKAVIDNGFKIADNVLVFVACANSPRTIVNPWYDTERANLINAVYADTEFKHRIDFIPIEDRPYNDTYWIRQIQADIYARGLKDSEVCLLGWKKDKATARYLEWFPQWDFKALESPKIINATDIRNRYFGNMPSYGENYDPCGRTGGNLDIEDWTPPIVQTYLKKWYDTKDYDYVKREFDFQRKHDEMYAGLKYKPIFTTVDAVVMCSGHVLMIKRRAHPGKDLWALPGGYLQPDEYITDGMVRELMEETNIKVPEAALRGSIESVKVFDWPGRSTRGRIITHAHRVNLGDGAFPKTKAADDAKARTWMPMAKLDRRVIFEDHLDIIHTMASDTTGDRRK